MPILTPSTTTTTRNYQIDPAGNKLLGFSQTMTQTGGATSAANVTYSYDANGALLTDGLRQYAYDSEGRLAAASLGWSSSATTDDSITKYAHNALAQRVFKTAPLYAVTNPEPTATPEILALFMSFFESLWSPITGTTAAAEKAGMSYVYDEDGTLIAQTLTGGASTTWGQSARYIYLPTASGPMPVAAIYGTKHYAIQSDHLNTPRRLIQSDGQVAWQWAYSAFGDEQPTIAKNRFANVALNQSFGSTTVTAVTFNLRYPGQYFDQESDLHYNYHRSYSAKIGRYTQSDPIGLDGGWNRYGYAEQNPILFTDPEGLQASDSGSSSLFPGPSACVYYEKKCNESCGEDKYACEAKQCCESFGGNMLSSCTRQCLITRDTKTCSKLKGKARNTCRQNAHYFCYAACFNAPDAISGGLGLFPPAACKGGAASSIGGMW